MVVDDLLRAWTRAPADAYSDVFDTELPPRARCGSTGGASRRIRQRSPSCAPRSPRSVEKPGARAARRDAAPSRRFQGWLLATLADPDVLMILRRCPGTVSASSCACRRRSAPRLVQSVRNSRVSALHLGAGARRARGVPAKREGEKSTRARPRRFSFGERRHIRQQGAASR